MALLPKTGLENHPDGTVGVAGIVNGNWQRLEDLFDPTLSIANGGFKTFWRAVVRSETDPTTPGAAIAWKPSASKAVFRPSFETIAFAASVAFNVEGAMTQAISLTGNLTFSALANQAAGGMIEIIIRSDGSSRNLTFPAGWKFIGAAAPASIAASKVAILRLRMTGATSADVVAEYIVEP